MQKEMVKTKVRTKATNLKRSRDRMHSTRTNKITELYCSKCDLDEEEQEIVSNVPFTTYRSQIVVNTTNLENKKSSLEMGRKDWMILSKKMCHHDENMLHLTNQAIERIEKIEERIGIARKSSI